MEGVVGRCALLHVRRVGEDDPGRSHFDRRFSVGIWMPFAAIIAVFIIFIAIGQFLGRPNLPPPITSALDAYGPGEPSLQPATRPAPDLSAIGAHLTRTGDRDLGGLPVTLFTYDLHGSGVDIYEANIGFPAPQGSYAADNPTGWWAELEGTSLRAGPRGTNFLVARGRRRSRIGSRRRLPDRGDQRGTITFVIRDRDGSREGQDARPDRSAGDRAGPHTTAAIGARARAGATGPGQADANHADRPRAKRPTRPRTHAIARRSRAAPDRGRRPSRDALPRARAGASERTASHRGPVYPGPSARDSSRSSSNTAIDSSESCVHDRRLRLSEPSSATSSSITTTFAWT